MRKLLLRGYRVRALVRGKEGSEEALPQSVQLVVGDLADYAACRRAVEGVDKASGHPGIAACCGGGGGGFAVAVVLVVVLRLGCYMCVYAFK